MKTTQEHARGWMAKHGWDLLDSTTAAREVFDSCIEVAQEEATAEAIKNRYQGEQARGAQRMAESILKQLQSLRG